MKDNRFLTKADYCEIINEETLDQIVKKGNEGKYKLAEDSAEMSIREYLTENYEIEAVFDMGKNIREYDRKFNYPVGAYMEIDGIAYRVTKSISGFKRPSIVTYWEIYEDYDEQRDAENVRPYAQLDTFHKDDLCLFNNVVYICREDNGLDYDDIRIPGIEAWTILPVLEWQPVEHKLNSVVSHNGKFYMLISTEGYDETIVPAYLPNCWGEISDYDPEYNDYTFSDTEYVVYEGSVFYPSMNPNSDEVVIGKNVTQGDPRNQNIKKHMVRLALYELTKNISPNNVSVVRRADYEESMAWLEKANKMKINPGIPRKVDEKGEPNLDWGMATFQRSYDPYANPWQI